MCSAMAAIAAVQVVSSMREGEAAQQAANDSAAVDERNAMLAEIGASDALARGGIEAGRVRTRTSRVIGAQRAAYGASGVDVTSGSALDVYASTRALGELDALTVGNNAARDAFGLKMRAADFRTQAEQRRRRGRDAANAILLSGITKAGAMFASGRGGGTAAASAAYKPSYDEYAAISD